MEKKYVVWLRFFALLLNIILLISILTCSAETPSCSSGNHGIWAWNDLVEKRKYESYDTSGHYYSLYFTCSGCGERLSEFTISHKYFEPHQISGGHCICGYKVQQNQCPHYLWYWVDANEYIYTNTTEHYRKMTIAYICTSCDEEFKTEHNEFSEPHWFRADGSCPCGYSGTASTTCKHTNKKSEKVGSVSKQYDDKYHETIVTYRDVCADCNAVLSAERKDTNKFDHRFDANGTCFCGYVQAKRPCDHTPTETLKDTKYGKADINGHEVIKTYHYECECKQVSYDEKKTSVGAHDYNRNTCRLCGFEKECEHPDFENVVSTAVEKNPNSASMHIIVTTYAEKCFCGAANPNPVKRTAEACRFIKNTDVQSVHEKQGHQYVDKCECGNEKANGKFKAYVSGCADCKQFYDQCVLSRGNASNIPEKVKELQELLMRSGYDLPYYGADGDFSRETEKAVEKFQKDHGLPVTGVVDEATWNALKNTLNYTDTLSKGNPSNKTHVVKELQELLIKNGYELPYYGADGDFSRETEKAVKKFQKDHGLPETGVVDEATWAMLRNPDGTVEVGTPSHSPAETLPPKADSDDDTEGTPSHCLMEGIDEGEADHGPMEGIDDDSPSHFPDATLPPKIEDESEVVIDGSFGKASYTAEIGNTLNISVRASSENANLERVTINVDGSGVDRLASEAISGTAWSGILSLNCNAYPLNTPGTYNLKLYVSADAGDPNWAIVDYATLVVNDAPVKPDKPVVNVSIDGNTMTATWSAVDGADRYVYSLYNITDDYRIVQHASANKLAASASLEAGKQYRIAVAAVPASVRDTMTETDMCSWTEVVFEMPIAEEADDMIPAVLSVTTNARSRTLLPGDPFTAAVVCNKYTSSLRVSGVENGYISNTYVDEEGRSCFAYTGSFTHNGVYQIRFTAVDPMGVYVENQTYSVVVPVTVCDHTVGEPVLVSEGKAEYANNDEHLIVCTYEKACICREIVENFPDNVLKAHVLSKSCAYDLEHKDGLGHRKYYVCSVCNGDSFSGGDHPGKDDYSEYEEDLGKSGRCAVCQDKYNEKQRIMEAQTLLQGLGYDIGTAGADGILGKDTLAALNAFRADVMGLGENWRLDSATLEALRDYKVINKSEITVPTCKHDWRIKDDSDAQTHPHNVILECDICNEQKVENVTKPLCCLCGNAEHVWVSLHPLYAHYHPMEYECSKCAEILIEDPSYDVECIMCNPNNFQWFETSTSADTREALEIGEKYMAIRDSEEFRDEYLYAPNGGSWKSDVTRFANGYRTVFSSELGVDTAVYSAVYISPEETALLAEYMKCMTSIIATDALNTWTLGLLDDLAILTSDDKKLTTSMTMTQTEMMDVLIESQFSNRDIPLERLKELEKMIAFTPFENESIEMVLNSVDLFGVEVQGGFKGVIKNVGDFIKWYNFISAVDYALITPKLEDAAGSGNGVVYEHRLIFSEPIEQQWISGRYWPTPNYGVLPVLREWEGTDEDGDGEKEWYMSSDYILYGTYEANPY